MALPEFDHPHGWTWRNDLPSPSSIHVEPAFKSELGVVFVRIDQDGKHLGIWLPLTVLGEFMHALRSAAAVTIAGDPDA
jgi:hypothetical protein